MKKNLSILVSALLLLSASFNVKAQKVQSV